MDKICPLPWLHLSTNPNGNFRLCCHVEKSHKIEDERGDQLNFWRPHVSHPLNSKTLKTLRQEMLAGEEPELCAGCFRQERSTGTSPRKEFLHHFKDEIPQLLKETTESGSLPNPQFKYLDLALNNHCNLECRMCTPRYSSRLHKTWRHLELKEFTDEQPLSPPPFNEEALQQIQSVNSLYFQGGEPFLSRDHLRILDGLNKGSEEISLRYNTNLTVLNEDILRKLTKYKKVVFVVSLDGWGKIQEYIRYPLRWDKFLQNLNLLKQWSQCAPFEIDFISTIQAYNFHHLIELFSFLLKGNYSDSFMPQINFLTYPQILTIQALPKKQFEQEKDKILDWCQSQQNENLHSRDLQRISFLSQYLQSIEHEPQYGLGFATLTKKFDSLRTQSWQKTWNSSLSFEDEGK